MPAPSDVLRGRTGATAPGRPARRGAVAAAGLLLALLTWACATTAPVRTTIEPPFPSPTDGPGVPEAPAVVRTAVAEGWTALRTTGPDAALTASRRAGRHPLASLLAAQAAFMGGSTTLTPALEELTGRYPGWASAWITLSFAAEREGRPDLAYRAAARAAVLWPDRRWTDRAAALKDAWAAPLAERARKALDAGDAAGALQALDELGDAAGEDEGLLLVRARALAELGRDAEARKTLVALSGTPEATALAASLAEEASDWGEALRLYSALPADWPGRERNLARIKLRWRLENLPPSFHEALASPVLDRARLATILVALAPEIEGATGGPVPVMTDVVGIPEQREVLAVVRAGIMEPSGYGPAFHPERTVTAESAAEVLGRLAGFLARPLPPSCGGTPTAECLGLADPVSGEMVRRAIWAILFPEEEHGDNGHR